MLGGYGRGKPIIGFRLCSSRVCSGGGGFDWRIISHKSVQIFLRGTNNGGIEGWGRRVVAKREYPRENRAVEAPKFEIYQPFSLPLLTLDPKDLQEEINDGDVEIPHD